MRAYKIAMFVILFQLSIPIAADIGITGPMSGMSTTGLITEATSSAHNIVMIGLPIIGGFVASKIGGLRANLGALVFLGAFTISSVPLVGTLSTLTGEPFHLMTSSMQTMLIGALNVVFLFAFIQLASAPAKGAH